MVSFPDAVKMFFSGFTKFEGRSSRSEYWWVQLLNFIVAFVLSFVGTIIGGESMTNILVGVYFLAIIIPMIALIIRRFHDLGQTGWLTILAFIPIVSLGILIWFIFPGTNGPNKYGPDPLDPHNNMRVFD